MKLGTKLLGAMLTICLMGVGVSAIGIYNASSINDSADVMYERELVGLSEIKEANIALIYVGRTIRSAVLAADEAQRTKAFGRFDAQMAKVEERMAKARPLFVTDKGKAAFAQADQLWQDFKRDSYKLKAMAQATTLSGNADIANFLFGSYQTTTNALDDKMTELADLKADNARQASEDTTALYERGRSLMVALVLLALCTGAVSGVVLSRSVTRALGTEPEEAADLARRVAEGDLSTPIHLRDGDTSSVMAMLRRMQLALSDVVAHVRSNAESVATASSQIAQGTADLSQRTEEQASALEQTAATMDELSSTVRTNADSARQACDLARGASEVASQGGTVVNEVVHTMKGIHDSSKRIAEIISVIDGIAFQTNILALNAAVEAARAGEQGRGFAVVAGEVRSLAQRSAGAAREIKSLITSSVEQVEQGSQLVNNAGGTMQNIVDAIHRVSDIVADITAASQEQSSGVQQVNQAVSQMDQVTQQNAALVEESAAASESLQKQAMELVRLVSTFKLAEDMATPAATRHTAPAAVPSVRKPPALPHRQHVHAPPLRTPALKKPEPVEEDAWASF
ncbi:MAG: methyl-accepting chemotaxis protein [Aquabacterium sp.]